MHQWGVGGEGGGLHVVGGTWVSQSILNDFATAYIPVPTKVFFFEEGQKYLFKTFFFFAPGQYLFYFFFFR